MNAEVQETREGAVVTLTMCNPGKLNAMSQQIRAINLVGALKEQSTLKRDAASICSTFATDSAGARRGRSCFAVGFDSLPSQPQAKEAKQATPTRLTRRARLAKARSLRPSWYTVLES